MPRRVAVSADATTKRMRINGIVLPIWPSLSASPCFHPFHCTALFFNEDCAASVSNLARKISRKNNGKRLRRRKGAEPAFVGLGLKTIAAFEAGCGVAPHDSHPPLRSTRSWKSFVRGIYLLESIMVTGSGQFHWDWNSSLFYLPGTRS